MNPTEFVDSAGKIAASPFSGYIILILVVTAMAVAFRTLWEFVKSQIAELRGMLIACQNAHSDCERSNRALALAVLDQAEGRKWEAKSKAEAVLSNNLSPNFSPGDKK